MSLYTEEKATEQPSDIENGLPTLPIDDVPNHLQHELEDNSHVPHLSVTPYFLAISDQVRDICLGRTCRPDCPDQRSLGHEGALDLLIAFQSGLRCVPDS